MKNSKVNRTKKSYFILSMIILIVVAFASTTFAWFTDKVNVDVSNTINFGKIQLSSSANLDVGVKRTNVDYSAGGKLMPGDTLVVKTTICLDEAYYFAEEDSNGNLVIYQTDGTTTTIQGTTTTSDKVVGKITKKDKHELKFIINIPSDFDDAEATTKFICEIGVIQQKHLEEVDARTKLMAGVNDYVPSD